MPELLERAINEGWTVEQAQGEFLRELRRRRPGPIDVRVTRDEADTKREALSDVVMVRAGLHLADKDRMERMRPYATFGFHGLARHCLQMDGERSIPEDPATLFERAVSTLSFPQILGEGINKTLAAAYQEAPSSFLQWAGIREVSDFKNHNELRLSAFSNLEQIGEAGELKHGTLTESKETYKAVTKGRYLAITRQMFVNDDLGAFAGIPAAMARAAKRTVDDDAYDLLTSHSGAGPTMNEDSVALFSTSRATPNYATGSSTALDATSLSTAKAMMRRIKGLAGEILNIRAAYLLVPPSLEGTAKTLVTQQYGPNNMVGNIHYNTLEPIVEARLEAGTNGTTAWYLVSRDVPSLVVVYLRGQTSPTVQRKDPTDALAIGWQCFFDWGVAAVDWRGIVRMKGVA